jgi:Leucine-rich repeat (LRR) protein
LSQFKTLKRLHLPSTIADPAVALLVEVLPEVDELDLSFSKVSDKAAADLAKLTKLTTLYLNDTEITDAALAPLAQKKSIKEKF